MKVSLSLFVIYLPSLFDLSGAPYKSMRSEARNALPPFNWNKLFHQTIFWHQLIWWLHPWNWVGTS